MPIVEANSGTYFSNSPKRYVWLSLKRHHSTFKSHLHLGTQQRILRVPTGIRPEMPTAIYRSPGWPDENVRRPPSLVRWKVVGTSGASPAGRKTTGWKNPIRARDMKIVRGLVLTATYTCRCKWGPKRASKQDARSGGLPVVLAKERQGVTTGDRLV